VIVEAIKSGKFTTAAITAILMDSNRYSNKEKKQER
jgi:hypothetical protein